MQLKWKITLNIRERDDEEIAQEIKRKKDRVKQIRYEILVLNKKVKKIKDQAIGAKLRADDICENVIEEIEEDLFCNRSFSKENEKIEEYARLISESCNKTKEAEGCENSIRELQIEEKGLSYFIKSKSSEKNRINTEISRLKRRLNTINEVSNEEAVATIDNSMSEKELLNCEITLSSKEKYCKKVDLEIEEKKNLVNLIPCKISGLNEEIKKLREQAREVEVSADNFHKKVRKKIKKSLVCKELRSEVEERYKEYESLRLESLNKTKEAEDFEKEVKKLQIDEGGLLYFINLKREEKQMINSQINELKSKLRTAYEVEKDSLSTVDYSCLIFSDNALSDQEDMQLENTQNVSEVITLSPTSGHEEGRANINYIQGDHSGSSLSNLVDKALLGIQKETGEMPSPSFSAEDLFDEESLSTAIDAQNESNIPNYDSINIEQNSEMTNLPLSTNVIQGDRSTFQSCDLLEDIQLGDEQNFSSIVRPSLSLVSCCVQSEGNNFILQDSTVSRQKEDIYNMSKNIRPSSYIDCLYSIDSLPSCRSIFRK